MALARERDGGSTLGQTDLPAQPCDDGMDRHHRRAARLIRGRGEPELLGRPNRVLHREQQAEEEHERQVKPAAPVRSRMR